VRTLILTWKQLHTRVNVVGAPGPQDKGHSVGDLLIHPVGVRAQKPPHRGYNAIFMINQPLAGTSIAFIKLN